MQNISSIQALASLLQAAENILFSFKISNDIVQKYETLRKKTFEKCGIPYIPVQIGVKFQEKPEPPIEKRTETQNKCVETDEVVEPDTLTPYLSVNLTIASSVFEKALKISNTLANLTNKTLDPVPLISPSSSSVQSEALKSQLSSQILSIDSILLTSIHYLQHLSSILESMRESLLAKGGSLQIQREKLEQALKSQKFHYEEQLHSLESLLESEKAKFMAQQESLEHIVDLQEKEIEIQGQELQDLKECFEQKKQESETIKKILQNEVIFANEERIKMMDEAAEKFESKVKEMLDNKGVLEDKVQELEKMLIQEREGKREEEERREMQFFRHLEKLNEEIRVKNEKLKESEIECAKLADDNGKIVAEISKILQFFTGIGLKVRDGEVIAAVLETLGKIKKLVEKLTVENNWLVDRLKYYEESNNTLRSSLSQTMSSEMNKESGKSNEIFTNFEQSRVNFRQFLGNKN